MADKNTVQIELRATGSVETAQDIAKVHASLKELSKGSQSAQSVGQSATGATSGVDALGKSLDAAGKKGKEAAGNLEKTGKEADQAGKSMETAGEKSKKAADNLDKMGKGAGLAGKAISATGQYAGSASSGIAKLVATLAGAVSAYKALEQAQKFISAGFSFSAEWEQSRIGIASVIAATSDLVDAHGNVLDGQEKYNAALGISEEAMQRIKIMGLETTATTGELVAGFQAMIGPANAVGMSMNQTMDFTLQMVQALGAMGIPLNQLSAEGRSLLDGTIIPTQDRLAVALGITGEMVKNWKEQGILVDELSKRLGVFSLAGKDVANTWGGLSSNMKDAFDFLAGTTGTGFFEGVKGAYSDLLDFLVDVKNARPGEDIENITAAIEELQNFLGQFVRGAANSLMDWLRELNKKDNIDQLIADFKTFGETAYDAGQVVLTVGGHITDAVGMVLDGWLSMPAIVQELGIIGALVFGVKGRAALAGIGVIIGAVENFVEGTGAVIAGDISFGDFATANSDDLEKLLANRPEKSQGAKQAQADLMQAFALASMGGTISPDFDMRALLEKRTETQVDVDLRNQTNANQKKQADARLELERTTKDALKKVEEALQDDKVTLMRSSISIMSAADTAYTESAKGNVQERIKAINAEYDAAIEKQKQAREAATKVGGDAGRYDANITVLEGERNKKLQDVADSMKPKGVEAAMRKAERELETYRRNLQGLQNDIAKLSLTEREYFEYDLGNKIESFTEKLPGATELINQYAEAMRKAFDDEQTKKHAEAMQKNLEVSQSFYKELAELSGNYSLANKLYLDEQIEDFRAAKIAEIDIARWAELKKLEGSRNWDDGIIRAATSYSLQATNAAAQMETAFTEAFTTIGNIGGTALAEIFETGEFNMGKFFASLTRQLAIQMANAATNQIVGGILGLISSGLGSLFGGGIGGLGSSAGKIWGGGGSIGSKAFDIGNLLLTSVRHTGGYMDGSGPYRTVAADTFANAPRYHSGGYAGLLANEVPAILKRNELVLTEQEAGVWEYIKSMQGKSFGGNVGGGNGKELITALTQVMQNMNTQPQVNVAPPQVVVVDDASKLNRYMYGPDGQRAFISFLNNNRAAVANVANGGRA